MTTAALSVDATVASARHRQVSLLTWAAGWAVAAPLTTFALAGADEWSVGRTTVLAAVAAAAVAGFGLPVWVVGQRGESRRPLLEAAGWTVAFLLAMVLLLQGTFPPEPTQPFRYPPFFVRLMGALALFGSTAGLISGFLSARPRNPPMAQMLASVGFGLVIAVVLPLAAVAMVIVVPIAAHLASEPFSGMAEGVTLFAGLFGSLGLAGACFGAIVEIGRGVFIAPPLAARNRLAVCSRTRWAGQR
jgi:hypothetical protein